MGQEANFAKRVVICFQISIFEPLETTHTDIHLLLSLL